jgi:hypothetical protein
MHALASRFDLVAVRAPGVDRRTLSEAWYDALHLASRSGTHRSNIPHLNARLFSRGKGHPWLREKLERRSGNIAATESRATRNFGVTEFSAKNILGERRAELSSLARDIIERVKTQPRATRFVFEVPQGRICLYVFRGERSAQIAAFCPAAVREVVETALAQVRYAL